MTDLTTFVSVEIDYLDPDNVPEFKFEALSEAVEFMEICFKNGFHVHVYQAY